MIGFNYLIEPVDGGVCVEFSGRMDECMELPNLSQYNDKTVIIDFESVTFINSLGIRVWLMWIEQSGLKKLYFRSLPMSIVEQLNMVEGFLPEASEVRSFYVPFYCEDCDEETYHYFEEGKEFSWGKRVPDEEDLQKRKCEECGSKLETAFQEKRLFRFLVNSLIERQLAS